MSLSTHPHDDQSLRQFFDTIYEFSPDRAVDITSSWHFRTDPWLFCGHSRGRFASLFDSCKNNKVYYAKTKNL